MAKGKSHHQRGKEPAMQKGEAEMSRKLVMTRIFVDPEASARFDRIAEEEGRTKQRQIGIVIENVARLHREHPEVLVELGLLSLRNAAAA
jgi:hypothetical protein